MRALIAFLLRNYTRSHRYFPPFGACLFAVMMNYSVKPNPVMETYGNTGIFIYVIAAWVAYPLFVGENPVQEQLSILHLGSFARYQWGKIAACLLIMTGLSLFTVLYPIVFDKFNESVGLPRFLYAWLVHMELAGLGIAIAYLWSSALWVKTSTAIAGILLLIALSSAQGTVAEALPALLKPLLWLLPPAHSSLSLFMRDAALSVNEKIWHTMWPLIYTGAAFSLMIATARRRQE
ncbi:hypothetical protein ABU162_23595 [Paenibacillus thiaminolyticus]|uniref:hypothetical protein n=1 Tax=Paenibacillus thiaminolyticus TaxID=49283 RepID=UPI0035A72166